MIPIEQMTPSGSQRVEYSYVREVGVGGLLIYAVDRPHLLSVGSPVCVTTSQGVHIWKAEKRKVISSSSFLAPAAMGSCLLDSDFLVARWSWKHIVCCTKGAVFVNQQVLISSILRYFVLSVHDTRGLVEYRVLGRRFS